MAQARWLVKEQAIYGKSERTNPLGFRNMLRGKWRTLSSHGSQEEAVAAAKAARDRGGFKRWAVFYRGRRVWES